MSQSIDVGTVLGGRYKVTSSIVESHDGDLVLDGVDQILNRPVSILVSAPNNAEQLAQSAREVATGERPIGIQVLDLGVSHGATYLITNHAAAADLLDLIVAQDAPYVEPFFTDTLGSEIFGEARSNEPETYDGLYEHGSHDYIQYEPGEEGQPPAAHPAESAPHAGAVPPPPSAPPQSANRATAAGIAAAAAAAASAGKAPTPPKVTPWSDAPASGQPAPATPAQQPPATAPSATQPAAAEPTAAVSTQPVQAGSSGSGQGRGTAFPAGARQTAWSDPSDRIFDRDDDLEEDDESTRPKSVPWLVGGILALVLIIALVFAFTTLGSVFQPQASPKGTASHSEAPSQTQSAGQTQAPAPAVTPVIDSVTRLHPEELTFANQFDSKLVNTYDGNPATYWSDMEFAREDWGGFSKSVSLAVKLKDVSDIKSVELDQLGGTGGSVSVYTNAQPDVAGATLVGTNTFNTTQLVFPLPNTVKAQYVIIQITALPRLAAPKTQYPYGLRLAEIKVE